MPSNIAFPWLKKAEGGNFQTMWEPCKHFHDRLKKEKLVKLSFRFATLVRWNTSLLGVVVLRTAQLASLNIRFQQLQTKLTDSVTCKALICMCWVNKRLFWCVSFLHYITWCSTRLMWYLPQRFPFIKKVAPLQALFLPQILFQFRMNDAIVMKTSCRQLFIFIRLEEKKQRFCVKGNCIYVQNLCQLAQARILNSFPADFQTFTLKQGDKIFQRSHFFSFGTGSSVSWFGNFFRDSPNLVRLSEISRETILWFEFFFFCCDRRRKNSEKHLHLASCFPIARLSGLWMDKFHWGRMRCHFETLYLVQTTNWISERRHSFIRIQIFGFPAAKKRRQCAKIRHVSWAGVFPKLVHTTIQRVWQLHWENAGHWQTTMEWQNESKGWTEAIPRQEHVTEFPNEHFFWVSKPLSPLEHVAHHKIESRTIQAFLGNAKVSHLFQRPLHLIFSCLINEGWARMTFQLGYQTKWHACLIHLYSISVCRLLV